MRIIDCSIVNFGSYTNLELSFVNNGLTVIHGPTGVGKSTIQDAPYWVLFGKSSKGGSVNYRRSWYSEDPLEGTVSLQINGNKSVSVTRIRGSCSQNDLWFRVNGGEITRGKDLTDTQRLINETLGFDADSYILNSYYTETSLSSNFFTATAKDRRTVVEKLTVYDFYNNIAKKAVENHKSRKADLANVKSKIAISEGILLETKRNLGYLQKSSEEWTNQKQHKIIFLEASLENIESLTANKLSALTLKIQVHKKTIQDLEENTPLIEPIELQIKELESQSICKHCGSNSLEVQKEIKKLNKKRLDAESKIDDQDRLQFEIHNLEKEIEELKDNATPQKYRKMLEDARNEKNPYLKQLDDVNTRHQSLVSDLDSLLKEQKHLTDLMKRDETIVNVVKMIKTNLFSISLERLQNTINDLIEAHFEIPMKVTFIASTADDFDVEILFNGNQSSYYQLSKGQRQMLKLCFGVSVMQVASERSGIDFKTLFFDEALDGMDTDMKVKAYSLFESIAKADKDVFVIDHNEEFRNMFSNHIEVKAKNGISWIEENG